MSAFVRHPSTAPSMIATLATPLSVAFAAAAIWSASVGTLLAAAAAGLMAVIALATCAFASAPSRRPFDAMLLVDFIVVAACGLLCDPNLTLWHAAGTWADLFRLSSIGAGVAAGLYIGVMALVTIVSGRRPSGAATAATAAIPLIFCLFMALGSGLPLALGRLLTFGAPLPAYAATWIGAAIDLFIVNEAIIAGALIALGRRRPLDLPLHRTLLLAAMFAAATPICADFGSSEVVASLPSIVAVLVTALAAAAAQAGLWGQTYLATQAIADVLAGRPPVAPAIRAPWMTGMKKGAVYGFVFIALVGFAGLLVGWAPFLTVLATTEFAGACLIGAVLYPLARTVMESTDSTLPFQRRLYVELARPSNYFRGLVIGGAVALALVIGLPTRSALDRFLFGVAWGAIAAAGVDLATGVVPLITGSRRHLASLRQYV